LGHLLFDQCRGIDLRPVEPNRIRKSVSVERTFHQDIYIDANTIEIIKTLHVQLIKRLQESAQDRRIKNQFIKLKFSNFKQVTLEKMSSTTDLTQYKELLLAASAKESLKIRLIGIGVHLVCEKKLNFTQQSLFDNT
jgi:DNA polymerase-4